MHARKPASPLRGLLLFLLGGLVGANATYFVMTRGNASRTPVAIQAPASASAESSTTGETPSTVDAGKGEVGDASQHDTGPVLTAPVVRMRGDPASTEPVSPEPMSAPTTPSTGGLLIPVQGISAAQLSDTFSDARGAGRAHDAIDIMAPAGTPVLAVADGHIEKLFNSKLGGLTIYHFNRDGTLAYYYAHLQRYAGGLEEQQTVTRGQVIGYVGATGNASPDAPHLHFAIFVLGPEKQWWKGEAINPYPRLAGAMR